MLLLLSFTLLVSAALSYQSKAQARSREEIIGSDHDISIDIDSNGQKVLEQKIPKSAGSSPMTASDLINLTTRTYLDPLPANPDISQALQNVSGLLWDFIAVGRTGDVNLINMMIPRVLRCKPVIRGTERLHSGVACGPNPCSVQTSLTIQENYASTERYRVESTVSAGVQIKGVSVSASTTRERNWAKTWGSSSSAGVNYEWNLPANGHCTPSMAHVELECDTDFDPVYYDTRLIYRNDLLDLEFTHNRKGGHYHFGQWCEFNWVRTAPLSLQQDWFPILPDDRYRGLMWKLLSEEMNRHRLYEDAGVILPSDVVISRVRGRGGDWSEIFVCKPDSRNGVSHKITVPLSSEAGALEGYLGCVTGPSGSEDTVTDAISEEL